MGEGQGSPRRHRRHPQGGRIGGHHRLFEQNMLEKWARDSKITDIFGASNRSNNS